MSDKYQPPNSLAKHQYFYTRDFMSLLHFKYKFALSTFLRVLTVDEVYYISNKFQPPNKLAKHQ